MSSEFKPLPRFDLGQTHPLGPNPLDDSKKENAAMTSDAATAESWTSYNLPHIEALKSKAHEPGIPWLVKVFRVWRAHRAIEKRNHKTFSNIGVATINTLESGRTDGKRLVIFERGDDGREEVVFEPTIPYPKLRQEGRHSSQRR